MRNILIVFGVLGLLIAGVAIAGSMQEPAFAVERSQTMKAPPEVVYATLTDFREFVKWSPWQEIDPDVETTFGGAERGLNAEYSWKGNREVGSGSMKIVGVDPNKKIDIKLEFVEPFQSKADKTYTITAEPEGSKVTWSMSGDKGGLMGQIAGMFMSFEEMTGRDFEKGLAKLKTLTEAEAKRVAEEKAKALEAAQAAAQAAEAAAAEGAQEEAPAE